MLFFTISYLLIRPEVFSSSVSLTRYLKLSRGSKVVDHQRVFLRVALFIVNVVVLFICLDNMNPTGLLSEPSFSMPVISTYLVADLVIFYLLVLQYVKQRHDYLTIFKTSLYHLLQILLIVIVLIVRSHGIGLTDIINRQNELFYGIPLWNALLLFPIFLIWTFSNVEVFRVFSVKTENSEIDLFQIRLLYGIRTIVWALLSVMLFMGGATSFGLTDQFNLNSATLKLLNITVVTLKMMLFFLAMKFYLKFVSAKRIVELERLFKFRVVFTLVILLLVSIWKFLWM